MRRLMALAAVIAGATALAVPAAMGAGNEQPANWIKIANNAQLVAPAGIYVTVTYSCLAVTGDTAPGNVFVSVDEGQDAPNPAFGSTSTTAICDDSGHTVTLLVPGAAFTPGTGDVFASVCGLACGATPVGGTEIQIR